MRRQQRRSSLRLELLESRRLMAGDAADSGASRWHNLVEPSDVNADGQVAPLDALLVINTLTGGRFTQGRLDTEPLAVDPFLDVDDNGFVSPIDALLVINDLGQEPQASAPLVAAGAFAASKNLAESYGPQNLLTESDVATLLRRAAAASGSDEAIIAVVDRAGRILGVRVEEGVDAGLRGNPDQLAFAIDGAVAKARTAAFFSNNDAPLTSRTIRFISQSTITQREVESSSTNADATRRGPGLVGPIGTGGHFPPEVSFTPQVDLFAIEHQSRDSALNAGLDGRKGTADDFMLESRFNVAAANIAQGAEDFFATWPESYGFQAGTSVFSQSRGIATLPGGVPLYKVVTKDGAIQMRPNKTPPLPDINLVGGIGVFFPGKDGFATHEQGFVHASLRGGVPQSESERQNAPLALEAEFIALVAAAGGGLVGPSAFVRDLSEFNRRLPALPNFVLPTGRIDLVGITLEIYGPTPSRAHPVPGIDRLIQIGRGLGIGAADGGTNQLVTATETLLPGQSVPEGWLVAPHASADGKLSAADVEAIIANGMAEADRVRAAIRLDIDNNFRPGKRTKMVLAVSDTAGEVLGLFRMPDATIFSIDVAIAKARNTAYYNDADDLLTVDQVDFNGDGIRGGISQSLDVSGDTLPLGTALTNRTFRFLVEPRFPTGIALHPRDADGLINDSAVDLCDQRRQVCEKVGPQSILRMPGINPLTAENLSATVPLVDTVYADPTSNSVLAFTSFNASRNFRDPGDDEVRIAGTGVRQALANQNGVVFFPGSTSLHVARGIAGGFGVSGDGVDQDDVVTAAGQVGFAPPTAIRADQFVIGFVRMPFQKFNRNPRGR